MHDTCELQRRVIARLCLRRQILCVCRVQPLLGTGRAFASRDGCPISGKVRQNATLFFGCAISIQLIPIGKYWRKLFYNNSFRINQIARRAFGTPFALCACCNHEKGGNAERRES